MQPTNNETKPAPQHGVKENMIVEGEGRVTDQPSGFRFGRMFPQTKEQPQILKLSTCSEIGDHMTAVSELNRVDSTLPAGYTYFGQFVDHDITSDNTADHADNVNPNADPIDAFDSDLVQKRSPSLDLDSLYGGAGGEDGTLFDGIKFKIGQTTPSPGIGTGPVNKALAYDLPRKMETRHGKTARVAMIGDPRNDENLVVAQTHLMWLKFHNAVVDQIKSISPDKSQEAVFIQAREVVTKHYQHVVLHDFIKRIISKDVYDDIVVGGNRKVLKQGPGEIAFMPLEFSVAAYRYGHSQVREIYDWNVNFGTGNGVLGESDFRLLFQFSEVSGNFGGRGPTLPTNWIADFRRLYDFDGMDFPELNSSITGSLNHARAIDPFLAPALASLPEVEMLVQMGLRPFANLASLNLRRGSMRALPTGQDISRELSDIRMLSKQQMKAAIDSEFDKSMERLGLYERTPLWLYVLLESKILGDGNTLGPLGSTIVADTFRTLVLTSRTSILAPGFEWTPADGQAELQLPNPLSTIPEILIWLDSKEPIIDPLQDNRLVT